MKGLLIIYLWGCFVAARHAIHDVCEDPKSATLSELAFVLFLTLFSWIGVIALNIGWNIKHNS
jgi:hypothetical protein